jgi:rRNA maturation endonuclease Nob1
MLVTLVGLVLVIAAALYVSWPMLRSGSLPEMTSAPATPATATPEKERDLVFAAIKDAEFDHEVGKLSDHDYAQLRAELEERALRVLAAIDAAAALRSVPPVAGAAGASIAQPAPGGAAKTDHGGFCPSCGHPFRKTARFCAGCGAKLGQARERSRRRA